jgi:predicted amidohydrolase
MFAPRITAAVTTATGAAAVGLAVATAGAAAAGTVDDAFITQMTNRGIAFSSPQQAVNQGHQVCTELAAGKNAAAITIETMDRAHLTPRQAGYFVSAAAKAYCPQFPVRLP